MNVKINNHDWEIRFVEPLDSFLAIDGRFCDGVSDSRSKTISVRNDRNEACTKQLLIHELTHAFLAETDISKMRNGYDEEELAYFNELNAEEIVSLANQLIKDRFKERRDP